MRLKILLLTIGLLLTCFNVDAATITRGETFTATDTVTNERLHDLVDDATIADLQQSDVKANHGFVIRSSSQPSDTDALWIDTSNNFAAAYVSGAYEEIGTTPTSVTTGAIIGTTGSFTGNVEMDGTLTVDGDLTVSSAGAIHHASIIRGWVRFNGDTVDGVADLTGVDDSFNVTSVVDEASGDYTINWNKDFSDDKYCVVATAGNYDAAGLRVVSLITDIAAGSVRIKVADTGGNTQDADQICVMAMGAQ